jgi:hypothetical protein
MTLVCPLCDAKTGKACEIETGRYLEVVHVARVKAATRLDSFAGEAQKNRKR